MIAGFLIYLHGLQSAQFLKAVVDQGPDTVLVDIDLALAVVGAAAGTVDQTLVTVGYRTDAAGLPDDAGAALGADLIKGAEGGFLADKQRIQGRHHHFF